MLAKLPGELNWFCQETLDAGLGLPRVMLAYEQRSYTVRSCTVQDKRYDFEKWCRSMAEWVKMLQPDPRIIAALVMTVWPSYFAPGMGVLIKYEKSFRTLKLNRVLRTQQGIWWLIKKKEDKLISFVCCFDTIRKIAKNTKKQYVYISLDLVNVNQKFRILAIYRTIFLIFPSNAARQIEWGIKVTDEDWQISPCHYKNLTGQMSKYRYRKCNEKKKKYWKSEK